MGEEKKKPEKAPKAEKLNMDDLENVSGGSLRSVPKVKTVDISDDTKSKI